MMHGQQNVKHTTLLSRLLDSA